MSDAGKKMLLVITDTVDNEFSRRVQAGLEKDARAAGWQVEWEEVGAVSYPMRLAILQRRLDAGEVTAAAYVHILLTPDQAHLFRKAKVPLGYVAGELPGAVSVEVDESEGAYAATRALVDAGHKRIALVAGPRQAPQTDQRLSGYQRALMEAGLEAARELEHYLPDFTEQSGKDAGKRLFEEKTPATAVFVAAGDLAAKGLIAAADEAGMKVPQDLSVVGYDDLPAAAACHPPLNSVRQPLEEMGGTLFRLLDEAVGGSNPAPEKLKPQLVERASVQGPPGAS